MTKTCKSKIGRPAELPEPWLTLAKRVGGGEPNVGLLIEKLHAPRRTFYNWVQCIRTPNSVARASIIRLFKEYNVQPPYLGCLDE